MKVALLTNFQEFNMGYSLTGIVKDQAKMLSRHGHEVHLFVNTQYHGESFSEDVILHKQIPFAHLIDYKSKNDVTEEHQEIIEKTKDVLVSELQTFDVAFTHDFIFTGWFLIYGLACKKATPELPNLRWLHWIHSVPTRGSDWWAIKEFGNNHKLVYPNETDRIRTAEAYRGEISDVRVIHHIKDLRTWFDFDPETWEFIDLHPAVMQADIVQIYPASTDRLSAKRVDYVMRIFSTLKRRGRSVCLVIANQWATGRQPRENVAHYQEIASRNGLKLNEEVVFTSEWKEEYMTGIPKRILRELFQCSNLFVFPTREESFGLVVPEAALSGGVLLVLNRSLQMQYEVAGYTGLYFDFGSYHLNWSADNEKKYLDDLAFIIQGRMKENESIQSKTYMRKFYNMDYLYQAQYGPIMAESKEW